MNRTRPVRILLGVVLTVGMLALCDAQSQEKNKTKAKASAKEPDSTAKVLAELMEFFDQKDVNRDASWSREEIINAYGLSSVSQTLKRLDNDQDGKISRSEYQAWAQERAPEMARERDEDEAEIQKYQEALKKASKEAQERIRRLLEEARERQRRRNDRRRDQDRDRKN